MRRGIGARWFDGDELSPCELWVERTDRNELHLELGGRQGERDISVYLTLSEAEELEKFMRFARVEGWRRA